MDHMVNLCQLRKSGRLPVTPAIFLFSQKASQSSDTSGTCSASAGLDVLRSSSENPPRELLQNLLTPFRPPLW